MFNHVCMFFGEPTVSVALSHPSGERVRPSEPAVVSPRIMPVGGAVAHINPKIDEGRSASHERCGGPTNGYGPGGAR